MYIRGIIILLISSLIFDLIFIQLNKSNPQIFSLFHKIPEKWKGKWYIRWMVILALVILLTTIQVYGGINENIAYMITGFILSLSNFVFKKSI